MVVVKSRLTDDKQHHPRGTDRKGNVGIGTRLIPDDLGQRKLTIDDASGVGHPSLEIHVGSEGVLLADHGPSGLPSFSSSGVSVSRTSPESLSLA